MADESKPTPDGMSEVSTAFVHEAAAATAAPPSSASVPDDPLVALGRQWQEAYDNWLQYDVSGDSREEITEREEQKSDQGKIAWDIEDQAANIPARSFEGALVKLRMAGTHCGLEGQDDNPDPYGRLTWQAWQGLERITTAAPQDERLAGTTTAVETPPAEDAAFFGVLAEYDRLIAIEKDLEHRKDVFRPGIPEAEEATKAYEAACGSSSMRASISSMSALFLRKSSERVSRVDVSCCI